MTGADELDRAIAALPPWALVTLILGLLAFLGFLFWLWSDR